MADIPDFPSSQDLADADDTLLTHGPRRVIRWVCECGENFPCAEVRFAMLVKGVRT